MIITKDKIPYSGAYPYKLSTYSARLDLSLCVYFSSSDVPKVAKWLKLHRPRYAQILGNSRHAVYQPYLKEYNLHDLLEKLNDL